MVSFAGMLTMLVELLSPLWAEACMFAVAVLVYLLFSGGLTTVRLAATKAVACHAEVPGKPAGSASSPASPSLKNSAAQSASATGKGGQLTRHAKAISAMGKEGKLEASLRIFNQLKAQGTPLNSLVYNCVLDACLQCGDMAAALTYFADAKDLGVCDAVSYNTILKGYLAHGDVKAAERVVAEMGRHGPAANRITYHALLQAYIQGGDRLTAWRLIGQMQASGFGPNAVTCSILLKAVSLPGHAADLKRVMRLVTGLGQQVDEVLFASVAEACIRTNSLDLLWEQMRHHIWNDCSFKLTAPTYGSMIKACGQACDVARMWQLWHDMTVKQVRPTAVTLGCMVEALVMNQCVEDAWQLLQSTWEDEEQRGSVNTVTYSTIMKGFSMAKQFDRVSAVYEEMKERGVPCNTVTYNTLLNALARCNLMHRAPRLLEDMQGANVEPDLVTYSTMIKGYCNSGDLDRSLHILEEMKLRGKIAPDEVLYNSLLDGCAKQHRLQDALKLLDEMRTAGIAPSNYTLSIAAKLLGRARCLDQAFAMVESVSREYGFRPNVQVYTCLMQACFHNRQVSRALAVHDELVRQPCAPDEKVYSVLARGCLQAGSLIKAVEVIRCAYHLEGHSLLQAEGPPPGVEQRCVDEVLSALGAESPVTKDLAAALQASRVSRHRPRHA